MLVLSFLSIPPFVFIVDDIQLSSYFFCSGRVEFCRLVDISCFCADKVGYSADKSLKGVDKHLVSADKVCHSVDKLSPYSHSKLPP
jgi:hypothetical protein